MDIVLGAVAQGLLWAIMAIGVYMTYRVLEIADLTAEGCFALGAAVVAHFVVYKNMDPMLATCFAVVAGMMAGLVTGILHTRFQIPALLAGILTMTALYSVNLRVMQKSNVSFLDPKSLTSMTVLSNFEEFGLSKTAAAGLTGLVVVAIVIVLLLLFFNTELGFALWATGNNEKMVRALGVNTDHIKMLGLIIGNALVGLSSALVGQYNEFADLSMGTGTIIIGLSSVIIGEVVFVWIFQMIFKRRLLFLNLVSVVLGSILYRLIIAGVLQLGMSTTDLKLFSSVILAIFLVFPVLNKRYGKFFRRFNKGGAANAST